MKELYDPTLHHGLSKWPLQATELSTRGCLLLAAQKTTELELLYPMLLMEPWRFLKLAKTGRFHFKWLNWGVAEQAQPPAFG